MADLTDKFKDIAAVLGEHYADFAILVRTRDNQTFWTSTDVSWAMGAMNRYLNYLDDRDRDAAQRIHENGGE